MNCLVGFMKEMGLNMFPLKHKSMSREGEERNVKKIEYCIDNFNNRCVCCNRFESVCNDFGKRRSE